MNPPPALSKTQTHLNGQVKVYEIIPNLADDSVRIIATEDDDGYSGNWRLTAYAICGYLEGAQFDLVEASHPVNGTEFKDATVSCDSGDTLLSAGLEIWSTSQFNNEGRDGRLTVDEIHPNGTSVATPTAATIWVLKDPSWSGPWYEDWLWGVDAYAICVDPS